MFLKRKQKEAIIYAIKFVSPINHNTDYFPFNRIFDIVIE